MNVPKRPLLGNWLASTIATSIVVVSGLLLEIGTGLLDDCHRRLNLCTFAQFSCAPVITVGLSFHQPRHQLISSRICPHEEAFCPILSASADILRARQSVRSGRVFAQKRPSLPISWPYLSPGEKEIADLTFLSPNTKPFIEESIDWHDC